MSDERQGVAQALPLVEVTRRDVVEEVHWGHVLVSTPDGQCRLCWGNPHRLVPLGDCARPFQALPLLLDGVDDAKGLSMLEIAVTAGTLSDQKLRGAVESLLRKALASPEQLVCPPPKGSSSRLASPCSGKHAGLLLYCQARGLDTSSYARLEGQAQQRILTEVLKLTRQIRSEVPMVPDRCGLPVACLRLDRLAGLFGQFSHPSSVGGAVAGAFTKLLMALKTHPESLDGDGLLATELARVTQGEVLAFGGSAGLIGAACTRLRLGTVVKLESGHPLLARALLVKVLREIAAITHDVAERSVERLIGPVRDGLGGGAGGVRFTLPV